MRSPHARSAPAREGEQVDAARESSRSVEEPSRLNPGSKSAQAASSVEKKCPIGNILPTIRSSPPRPPEPPPDAKGCC